MLDRKKDTTLHKSEIRLDSTAFDQTLFESKLGNLIAQNTQNFEAGRLRVHEANLHLSSNINEPYLMKLVDVDVGVLRGSFVPAVDKTCREVWLSGGNDITARFIREKLVPRVLAAVNDRRTEIRQNLETLFVLVVSPPNWCLPSVLAHLAREMDDLKDDLKTRYEIDAVRLEEQAIPKANAARKAQLTDRESKLWELIQRGLRGLTYCREVDAAKVSRRERVSGKVVRAHTLRPTRAATNG